MLQHREVWQPSRPRHDIRSKMADAAEHKGRMVLPMSAGWWPDTDELLAVFDIGDLAVPGLDRFARWDDDHLDVGFTDGLSVVRRDGKITVTVSGVRWGRYPVRVRSVWQSADSCFVGAARGISNPAGKPDLDIFIQHIVRGRAWVGEAAIR